MSTRDFIRVAVERLQTAFPGVPVFTSVPDNPPYPHIAITEGSRTPGNDYGLGLTYSMVVNCWNRNRSREWNHMAADYVVSAFHEAQVADGYTLVSFTDIISQNDGITHTTITRVQYTA